MSGEIDQEVLQTFFEEVNEHLQEIESILLRIDESPDDLQELLNSLFRSFHTIKGTAEMFGFKHVSVFTHTAETLLMKIRNGEIAFSEEYIDVFLKCRDHINDLLQVSEEEILHRKDLTDYGDKLTAILEVFVAGKSGAAAHVSAVQTPPAAEKPSVAKERLWSIKLKFKEGLFFHGLDPYPIIRYLRQMGSIKKLITHPGNIPAGKDFDPEKCYLNFDIVFQTVAGEKEIEENFDFVRDDCTIEIQAMGSYTDSGESAEPSLVDSESLDSNEPAQYIEKEEQQAAVPMEGVQGKMAELNQASIASADKKESIAKTSKSFRVDSERIDDLINKVSELVMSGAQIGQISTENENSEMIEASYQLSRIITDIRESTLRLRMVPVGGVFNRFKRIVHDLSKDLGKDVLLHLRGVDTELDKTVVEQITDPLMHLIRNSLDHGIEDRETRIKNKKFPQGNLFLEAYNEAGDIVIQIRDDGGGLSREKIVSKALERGLINPSQSLNDREIYQLVFEPGFSTASKITNISGRGVGLDVVRRNIDSLGGTIELSSKEGLGTTFRIKLPLTLATIDGFMVTVSGVKYAIPLDTVSECIEFKELDAGEDRNIINLRGEILPFVKLKDLFERMAKAEHAGRQYIVVVQQGDRKAGLVVDEIHGEMQSVIKPLGAILGKIEGIGGSTILGNGEVAFIMDVHSLIRLAERSESENRTLSANF